MLISNKCSFYCSFSHIFLNYQGLFFTRPLGKLQIIIPCHAASSLVYRKRYVMAVLENEQPKRSDLWEQPCGLQFSITTVLTGESLAQTLIRKIKIFEMVHNKIQTFHLLFSKSVDTLWILSAAAIFMTASRLSKGPHWCLRASCHHLPELEAGLNSAFYSSNINLSRRHKISI